MDRRGKQGGGHGGGGHLPGGRPWQDRGGQAQSRGPDPVKVQPRALPEVRYRDDGRLRPALFDEEARAVAEGWRAIRPAQLRRFFSAVMAFVRRMDLEKDALGDGDARVSMALLKASATYAAARSDEHRPIQTFLDAHAAKVRTRQDYRDFARHFEAVIAYHAVHAKSGHREDAR